MRQVLAEALALPPVERAELIERLHESFNRTDRENIDHLWAQEAEERIDAYERGEIGSSPASSVFEKINSWKK
jgi:putative addiction module component (TIGR02574 family)